MTVINTVCRTIAVNTIWCCKIVTKPCDFIILLLTKSTCKFYIQDNSGNSQPPAF